MQRMIMVLLGCLGISTCMCNAQEIIKEAQALSGVCMTEPAGYYADSTEIIQRRLACYHELGVEMLRVETGWEKGALPAELLQTDLRVKLILYVLGIPPAYNAEHLNEAMLDQHGRTDWHLGPWHLEFRQLVTQAADTQMERLKTLGVLERIDEVVADLGPAGEGIYPANWTLGREGEEAFWCYSETAQADFRKAMQLKYATVQAANDAWNITGDLRFTTWETVQIPQPGTEWARGSFWADMLTWYRDAKRAMMEYQIDNTLRVTQKYLGDRAKVIVYLPGYAYSQEEWDRAVAEASGSSSIRLMMDNDWLMDKALEKGCLLQYTGAENASEVARIINKLKNRGVADGRLMWAENAGWEGAGRDPMWLAQIVCAFDLRGVDFTWSNWLFEEDHITPSPTYAEFIKCSKTIRHFRETGELPAQEESGVGTMRVLAPGKYVLTPSADTRLMGSFPYVIKGRDPEIAVVEGGQTQRMLFRFPMDSLPSGRQLKSATLKLHSYIDYDDETQSKVNVYRITQPWQEHAANWQARTLLENWDNAGGDAIGCDGEVFSRQGELALPYASALLGTLSPGQVVEWNLTGLCREWATGQSENYGMLVTLESLNTANKSFAAREHPVPDMWPRLVIELVEAP